MFFDEVSTAGAIAYRMNRGKVWMEVYHCRQQGYLSGLVFCHKQANTRAIHGKMVCLRFVETIWT